MEKKKAKAVLEAILFTMGDSVEIDRLAAVIEEDKETTRRLLEEMAADYQKGDRGIGLTTFDNAVQMCTKSELYEYLIKIAKTPKKFVLTDTLLETLSIIYCRRSGQRRFLTSRHRLGSESAVPDRSFSD